MAAATDDTPRVPPAPVSPETGAGSLALLAVAAALVAVAARRVTRRRTVVASLTPELRELLGYEQ